ncbi:MAG: SIS domain-containing protein [Dehalococcoidales bacterium]|nr:SIS domain-containing protein [Dehalococcoidales bacterium]
MNYTDEHLKEAAKIAGLLDRLSIEKMVDIICAIRKKGGRLFFLGVGGGAGNATHAVNDFRKIAGIESYSPLDNISELTARINDDGWEEAFLKWLKVSRLNSNDGIFIFSVGGGNEEKAISVNLVRALQYAKETGAAILGIIGRDGGYTARVADGYVIIPTVNPASVTPHTEAFQAVVWHLIVSHPKLKAAEMKWESVK